MEKVGVYGPQQVCDAAGVSRATFHSWIARQYLPLPPPPGSGRERQFTILDAVRIAVAADLTRLGISVGIAGRVVGNIEERMIDSDADRRTALVLGSSWLPTAAVDEPKGPGVLVCAFKDMGDIEFMLPRLTPGASPVGFVMIDVTAVAERTRHALEKTGGDKPPPTWLDQRNPLEGGAAQET